MFFGIRLFWSRRLDVLCFVSIEVREPGFTACQEHYVVRLLYSNRSKCVDD
jgi:hypothetical protein